MSSSGAEGAPARPGYLIEVQGLRTAAALLVAIYHIWLNRVSGGVDVFFVVAGFFLVATFEKRAPSGLASLRDYYATTLRRVLPVAVLVMLATIGLWMFVLPDVLWDGLAPHAVYTAAFVENLHLAAISTNYLQPSMASPFQQFWALSLQMQVYVGLPVLLLLAGLAGRWLRIPLRAMLTVALGLLFAGSLAYSVVRTGESQPQAYFETGTRLWEFAGGGLLALWSRAVRLPKWAASVLGWLGLAGLLLMGLVVDVSRSFPGTIALLPIGFAAAIIICAQNGGVVQVLRNRYVVAFGDYSFAFYLWHWPLLIATRYLVDSPKLTLVEGLAIIVLAAVLAYFTTRLAETPIRRSQWLAARPWGSVMAGVALAMVPLAAGLGWHATDRARLASARNDVAAFVAAPRALAEGEFMPALVLAARDTPRACRVRGGSGSTPVQCEFGDRSAKRIIVVAGGSHADQYLPAIDAYGKREGYKIIAMTKGRCHLATGFGNRSCRAWNKAALKELIKLRPALVVTNGTQSVVESPRETMPKSAPEVWKRLGEAGVPVLAIRDNPRFVFAGPTCLARSGPTSERCSTPVRRVLAKVSPFDAGGLDNVTGADFTSWICPHGICSSAQDGVVVYRDDDHLTRTFVLLHEPQIAAALDAALKGAQPR